eukprot:CAMPEP_0179378150 /NCGR_PEP_ID=MMETSP0797-20121207/89186_1 /TAXON_ID=47934 /ORGANISM="Dinophysis acuminata, Strain DAEP01" /LENGTH=61 /DNA_ID=CAMNT_0021094211 /DNA_START=511 /DNA_END=693 /DNA_ORIENTATION=+
MVVVVTKLCLPAAVDEGFPSGANTTCKTIIPNRCAESGKSTSATPRTSSSRTQEQRASTMQ